MWNSITRRYCLVELPFALLEESSIEGVTCSSIQSFDLPPRLYRLLVGLFFERLLLLLLLHPESLLTRKPIGQNYE